MTISNNRNAEINIKSVYEDLGYEDHEEMEFKSKCASRIGDIIAARQLTQVEAAKIMSIKQPKLSDLLRGKFRGISRFALLEYLSRLGENVQVVVRHSRINTTEYQSVASYGKPISNHIEVLMVD